MVKTTNFSFFIICLFYVFMTSCNTSKYIKDGQTLLTKNSIKFEGKEKIPNKTNLEYELSTLQQPKANTNFLWLIPREWYYFKNQVAKDTTISRWRRWENRVLSERPAWYKPTMSEATEEAMKNYLFRRGYFKAEVDSEDLNPKDNDKTIQITYLVNLGERFTMDTVTYISQDTAVQKLLRDNQAASFLKKGEPVDRLLYNQEVGRITTLMRNRGYAYFYPNFIAPLDGTSNEDKVNIEFTVLPPTEDLAHKKYWIGKVYLYPDYDAGIEQHLRDTMIDDMHFMIGENGFRVKPQTLISHTFLKEGKLFQQKDFDKTNNQFNALGVYKFVSIKQEVDIDNPELLNFHIYLTRSKQMEIGTDFEISTTNPSVGSSGNFNLLGFSLSPYFKNRNFFRGSELFIGRAEAGVELDLTRSRGRILNTLDVKVQAELYIPKFLDYLGLWRLMNKFGKEDKLISDEFYTSLKEKSSTRLSASYNALARLGFFRYDVFNATFGYDLQRSSRKRYVINHVGVDLLISRVDSAFQDILMTNPFLAESFGSQLFTGLLFRDLSYVYSSRANRKGGAWQILSTFETSGVEVWATNSVYNWANKNNATTFNIIRKNVIQDEGMPVEVRDTIDFSQYFRFDFDARYTQQFSKRHAGAVRMYAGAALPFGFSTEIPYVKQYFVGGPNSLRAFPARQLGPGAVENTSTIFYQTGDVKLEFNAEYRYDWFKIYTTTVELALFLDAGNVWNLGESDDPLGNFRLSALKDNDGNIIQKGFWDQIAIGTGLGMRFDLSFFIFRFDVGYPMRYPYLSTANDNKHWQFQQPWDWNKLNYNISLGYPF